MDIRASQTDEQREARNEAERNRWNRNQKHRNVAFNPYRAAFNYNVQKSITVYSKSLLLDQ